MLRWICCDILHNSSIIRVGFIPWCLVSITNVNNICKSAVVLHWLLLTVARITVMFLMVQNWNNTVCHFSNYVVCLAEAVNRHYPKLRLDVTVHVCIKLFPVNLERRCHNTVPNLRLNGIVSVKKDTILSCWCTGGKFLFE